MNNDVLQGLVGQQVELRGESATIDKGILQAYDDRWVVLKKLGDELLYFPIANVRLLKPLR